MIIWAILDDRAGNSNQVLGLVNSLNLPFQTKSLIYTKSVILPNFIRGNCLIGLKNKEIINEPFPDLVISAGRRSAPIARYIKKKSPTSKLIQIMSPDFGYKDFSLIILPTHDRKINTNTNIVTTIGSLHKVNKEILAKELIIWSKKLSHLKPPFIGLFVGGNSKSGFFNKKHAIELADIANKLASKLNASLLITTSRRTDNEVKDLLIKKIIVPYNLYSYGDNSDNPYLGYLSLADYLIVTGDSISMISECCYTGKSVFIYAPDNITGIKHKLFHKILFDNFYATKLVDNDSIYNFKPKLILDEMTRISNQILKTIKI